MSTLSLRILACVAVGASSTALFDACGSGSGDGPCRSLELTVDPVYLPDGAPFTEDADDDDAFVDDATCAQHCPGAQCSFSGPQRQLFCETRRCND